MSAHQPDAEAGQPNAEGPPGFRVVRRGTTATRSTPPFPSSPRAYGRRGRLPDT
jgi:hypothetical protein